MTTTYAAIKSYEFPSATIKRMRNGTYIEFPKWCQMISVERSRGYVAKALISLRKYNKRT